MYFIYIFISESVETQQTELDTIDIRAFLKVFAFKNKISGGQVLFYLEHKIEI